MSLSCISNDSETYQLLSLAQSAHMDKSDADQASRIFQDKDQDGSGGLSLEEMGCSQAMFDQFDTDKDGVISPAELQQGLKKIRESAKGQAESEVEKRSFLGRVQSDMDQDGQDADAGDSALGSQELAAYTSPAQSSPTSSLLRRTLV